MKDRKAYLTKDAISSLIANRGANARRLWNIASGYSIFVTPEAALDNLKNMVDVLKPSIQAEAKSLIRDIEKVVKTPPFPG